MTLRFQPLIGQILICDFPREFSPPEMVKRRPVIAVSKPDRSRFDLVTVVPLSTTPPKKIKPWDVRIELTEKICGYESVECWAKCDMIYNFKYSRFNLPLIGKGLDGKRIYQQLVLEDTVMHEIQKGILSHLGIEFGKEPLTKINTNPIDEKNFPF